MSKTNEFNPGHFFYKEVISTLYLKIASGIDCPLHRLYKTQAMLRTNNALDDKKMELV